VGLPTPPLEGEHAAEPELQLIRQHAHGISHRIVRWQSQNSLILKDQMVLILEIRAQLKEVVAPAVVWLRGAVAYASHIAWRIVSIEKVDPSLSKIPIGTNSSAVLTKEVIGDSARGAGGNPVAGSGVFAIHSNKS
jgi:hypothetical protein